MKRFSAFLAIAAVIVGSGPGPVAARTPAFEALKASVAVPRFEVPSPSVPLLCDKSVPPSSLAGEALFDYLHDATAPAARKLQPSYKASKAFMYAKADNAGCNGGPGIMTFYSQVCVNGSSDNGDDYKERGDQNGDGVVDAFINAEHLWPQGYFNKALPMVADLHHLAPTFVTPNGRRANFKFNRVSKASYSTYSGSKLGTEGFEPANAVKGNVARAMLYFVVRYYDRHIRQGMDYNDFWKRRVPMLLEWNRQDPPDAAEFRRNALIEEFQGNRNPFVDDPSLADRIGGAVFAAH